MQDDDFDAGDVAPSKSQLKREAHAQQQLGIALLDIAESEWQALQLPDKLIAALKEAKRLHARGAHKRQLQYIGKLMRDIDTAPIEHYFEEQRLEARRAAQQHHALEDWRDRIIEQGDTAIDAFLAENPQADRQHLRQLARQASKEQARNAPPKASRSLFRYLREIS